MVTIGLSHFATSQTFTSKQNGDWQQNATWANPSFCNSNPSAGTPPISKDWGCAVEAVIRHDVRFVGNANNFGSGAFDGVDIKNGGKFHVTGNLSVAGWGSVPFFKMESGAEIQIDGRLTLHREVNIRIPSGARVILNELVIGDNSPRITVDEGAELIVLNTTQLNDRSRLNVDGKFVTKDLRFTSGGTINANGFNSLVEVLGDLKVQNGNFNISHGGTLKVEGKTNVGQSGNISLTHSSFASFGDDMIIPNGASLRADNNSSFMVEGDLTLDGGGILQMRNNTEGIITGNVVYTNGKINTHNHAELYIGGYLQASNGAEVNMQQHSKIFICDFLNSTQAHTYHINQSNNSFYGQGCLTLPVTWNGIDVKFNPNNGTIKLTWGTTTERENSHFIIERSINGLDDFQEVGEVLGAGWSSEPLDYYFEEFYNEEFKTQNPHAFYRVKQVDFNGNYDYSEVVRVSLPSRKPSSQNQWSVFPNPTNGDQLKLRWKGEPLTQHKQFSAKIVNLPNAREIHSSELGDLELHIKDELKRAPRGICIVEIIYGDEISHIKVLKN